MYNKIIKERALKYKGDKNMLEIKNLTKIYKGGVKAVNNLSLKVMPGDIYGFIGHNGAGKTTTIKCVVGIHDFDEGDILIDGVSVKDNPLKCKSINISPSSKSCMPTTHLIVVVLPAPL